MKKKIGLITILSLAHLLISILSGALGWDLQTVIVSVVSILSIVIANRKFNLSLPASIITVVPFFILYSVGSLTIGDKATYPIWILGIIASFLTVFLLKHRIKPTASVSILTAFVLAGGLFIWPNTFSYLHSENPDDYTFSNLKIVDAKNNIVNFDDFKGKVILFDIWHSACLPCIKQFPEIQKLYDHYKGDSSVRIISLNIPLEKDKGIKPARFTDPYTFEKLYFLNEKEYDKFSYKILPLILIMDKNFHCRYSGSLNVDWNIFIGNAKKIIKKLKKENE